ncbi:Prolyl endopeptidase precursor [Polystyrenella longa]|uniref:prolyl oligopeptidase n=2 Tax=Polystyrenella longa TaxID=2528007 RepID=A0A518CJ93_9PLAN|nr:prolyl oligopeptidase family serine peptidase [Polystyrenella longa]QDU79298.1 Prolyl endopeptidase precursor [Polystyrenella longa]
MKLNVLLSAVFLMCGVIVALAESVDYPESKIMNQVDNYHGTEVADPYRWLEDDVRESAVVKQWVEKQNEVTFDYLEKLPMREAFQKKLEQLWNFERYSIPYKIGGRYFYRRNDGLQNQSVLYVLDELDGEPRVLLDPNQLSEDGTTALARYTISDDGKLMAYALSESGSDWNKWYVMDIDTGEKRSDEIQFTKFTSATWTKDNQGFFYSRFPEPKDDFQDLNKNQKVYYHRIGTPQAEDKLIYERPDEPDWGFANSISDDGRYLILSAWKGTDPKARIFYKDLTVDNSAPVALIDHFENEYGFLGNDGELFYFVTDKDAPRRRVIAIDLNKPEPENWREIIPEAEAKLDDVSLVNNLFVINYLEDVKSRVRIFNVAGKHVRDVELAGIGTASGFNGERTDTETFYAFQSFIQPPTIYRYNLITGEQEIFRKPEVDFSPEDLEVQQVFYESKDGTPIPMFLISKKGLQQNCENATILYGYGGFGISLTPGFSVGWLSWVEMGGVVAIANLRGGGEYGEEWHQAGTKLNKQNVFDDFISAGKWLIENNYTQPAKLGITGRSNGGLLIGAVLNQAPELFGAAVPGVGVMDMLRFHQFTAGRYWVDDYGSAENPEEFDALYAYSPYHNIKEVEYPATLVITADTDDRVVPGHSFKYIARLQEQQQGEAPVMIRIETSAGHGAGTPISKVIEEKADTWAFFAKHLGLKQSP